MIIGRRILTPLLMVLACCGYAYPAVIDDARSLYQEGEYEEVVKILAPAVKKTPKDGNVTYYLGASLYELGNADEAEAYLTVAQSRNVADASRILALISLERYDPSAAQSYCDKWEELLKKQKKSVPDEFSSLSSKIIQMQNMLDRVERIEIIDTLLVDKNTFFKAYRLSPTAGRLLPADALSSFGAGTDADQLSVAYIPENRSELLWAAAEANGRFGLYSADILDDGTIDHTTRLDDSLGDGGDAMFPFLMPDGMTLYFANNGDNTLGGYDIFMTRRTDSENGKEYFTPQNIGLPYNSPYDDYLLAIDEASGLGWWASDRNQIPDKVTIYIFAPSKMRINADPSDPNLRQLASLADLAVTQKEGVDYKSLLASRLPEETVAGVDINMSPKFRLDMGNGRVYTKLSDFSNERARMAMLEVLSAEVTLRKHLEAENRMRDQYRRGDKTVADAILASEQQTDKLRQQIAAQRNTAVRLETK